MSSCREGEAGASSELGDGEDEAGGSGGGFIGAESDGCFDEGTEGGLDVGSDIVSAASCEGQVAGSRSGNLTSPDLRPCEPTSAVASTQMARLGTGTDWSISWWNIYFDKSGLIFFCLF